MLLKMGVAAVCYDILLGLLLSKMGMAAICYKHFWGLLLYDMCYLLLNGLCYMLHVHVLETPSGPVNAFPEHFTNFLHN